MRYPVPFALLAVVAVISTLLRPAALLANETDQFILPPGQEWADLGDFFSQRTYRALVTVVDETNAQIHDALERGNRRDVQRLQSPHTIAHAVYQQHGLGFREATKLENLFHTDAFQAQYPGQMVSYLTNKGIYHNGHLPIDYRNLFLLQRNSTVKIYGVWLGLDKIGHFHHLGYEYYKKAIDSDAATQEDAAQGAVRSFSKGIISEGGLIGNFTAGVYSNGDLAANYVGMKFYFNLTAPARLQGEIHPPMIVRKGEYWALNDYVKPGAPIFRPFISEHLSEALNPCVYTPGLRGHVARTLRDHPADILAFYCDQDGRVRPRRYFEEKVHELWTYYGENYGHSSGTDNLVTIAGACFEQDTALAGRVAKAGRSADTER